LLIRRDLLDQLGGFDEDFFLYAEEVDFAFRAAQAGWRSYLVPTARVRHAEGSSTGQVVPLKLASHYFCKAVYFASIAARPRAPPCGACCCSTWACAWSIGRSGWYAVTRRTPASGWPPTLGSRAPS